MINIMEDQINRFYRLTIAYFKNQISEKDYKDICLNIARKYRYGFMRLKMEEEIEKNIKYKNEHIK